MNRQLETNNEDNSTHHEHFSLRSDGVKVTIANCKERYTHKVKCREEVKGLIKSFI